MNEILIVSPVNPEINLLHIPPVEPPGSTTVVDTIKGTQFTATSGASVISHAFGDSVLSMAGGHFQQLTPVNIGTDSKPFSLELDIFLLGLPVTEGVIFSQIDPASGGGTFALTMYNGPGGRQRVSFFWTTNGNIASRRSITSDRDLPLSTSVHLKVVHTGTEIQLFFDDVLVASDTAPSVFSGARPIGIGGHYGTQSYNMNGMLKNIKIIGTR